MATSRKKAARPKSKTAKHARPAAKAKPKPKPKPKAAVHKPAPKAAAKKPAPVKPAGKAAAKAAAKPVKPAFGKPGAGKPAGKPGAGKPAAKGAPSKKGGRPAVPETVRPIGVLPPESMARPKNATARIALPPRPAPEPARATTAPKREERPLTDEDLKHFEQRLLEERQRLMREMGHLENTVLKVNQRDSSGDLSGYSFHMADAGTDAYEREKAFLFASSEGRTLFEVNEALRRVYKGTFGVCEISGKPIARARLEAIPWARYTLEVQEQLEKEERSRRGAP